MDWLPDAIRDPHGRSLAWTETADPKGVLHTTESSSWPSYRDWADCPHATVLPTPGKGVTVHQHVPFSRASFALVHGSGQQATNTDYAFQFELVGTSDKNGPGYYWPAADDAVLLDLYKKVIKPLSDAYRIPITAPTFKPYPASYGANGVRLSQATWDTYTGWLGHQHVPENDHGDPGAFPWARLMELTSTEDDLPLTDDDAAKVAKAIANQELGKEGIGWAVALQRIYNRPVPTAQDIAAAIVAQFKTLPAGTATVDDATIARIVKAVWDEGATRLVR
jgi:hypothetical protein